MLHSIEEEDAEEIEEEEEDYLRSIVSFHRASIPKAGSETSSIQEAPSRQTIRTPRVTIVIENEAEVERQAEELARMQANNTTQ